MSTIESGLPPRTRPLPRAIESGLLAAHTLAALLMVVLRRPARPRRRASSSTCPTSSPSSGWLTWGRVRFAHTQGMLFGWLGNAFLAFLYYAVPRLADRPVTSRGLGWLLFAVWNFAVVIPGWVCVHLGYSQGLEWAEFPLEVDVLVLVGLFLSCVQFVVPLLRSRLGQLYVSGWYIVGALVFTLLAFPVGNFVPEIEAGGARGDLQRPVDPRRHRAVRHAAGRGDGVHRHPRRHRPADLQPLPLAGRLLAACSWSTRSTARTITSSRRSRWTRRRGPSSPRSTSASMSSSSSPTSCSRCAVSAGMVARDMPLRFVWLGVVFYLIVSLQGSMQALMPVNRFTHFSDWVIGHSHLALIGFASFIAIGGLLHVWRSQPGFRYNPRAANWGFWLLSTGLFDLGGRPDHRRARAGALLAVRRPLARLGACLDAVLADADDRRGADAAGLRRRRPERPDRPARRAGRPPSRGGAGRRSRPSR